MLDPMYHMTLQFIKKITILALKHQSSAIFYATFNEHHVR